MCVPMWDSVSYVSRLSESGRSSRYVIGSRVRAPRKVSNIDAGVGRACPREEEVTIGQPEYCKSKTSTSLSILERMELTGADN